MKNISRLWKRILALTGVVALLISQLTFVIPTFSNADSAGGELKIYVQYFGEIGNKVRLKTSFSRSELESMGQNTYYYSNVTSVGTIMTMAAKGPTVMSIIEAAGIDSNSVKNITFDTEDGYTRNFTVAGHMTATKYYYPNLSSLYERNEAGTALTPLDGALDGGKSVPAILATSFGESKAPGTKAEDLGLSTNKTYRFCMGQSKLTEGVMTNPSANGGDISSIESCHSIRGIYITLYGSPVKGIDLSIDGNEIKVGSQKKISAHINVVEEFKNEFTTDSLTWTSSNTSIAEVDKSGNVTVKKSGAFTITATAPDGSSASITINGKNSSQSSTGSSKSNKQVKTNTTKTDTEKKVTAVYLNAREITLGDVVVEETSVQDERRKMMSEDAQALGEAETYSHAVALGTAVGASLMCVIGVLVRIIKYKKFF